MGRPITKKEAWEIVEKRRKEKEERKKNMKVIKVIGVAGNDNDKKGIQNQHIVERMESFIEFVKAIQELKRSVEWRPQKDMLFLLLEDIKNEQRRIKDEMTRTMLEAEHTRAMINHDIGIIKMLMGVGIIIGLIWLARRFTGMGFAPVGVVRPLPQGIYTGRDINPIGQGVVVPPVPAWETERGSQKKKSLIEKIRENAEA